MALFNQRFAGIRRVAGAVLLATLFTGASTVAMNSAASAAPDHRGGHPGFARGHVAPGFHGPGRFGRGYYPGRGWYGAGWPGYAYYGWPYPPYNYVRYYYPQYYYPQYRMPTAAYVMPPPPPAMAPQSREFTVYFDFDHYQLTGDGRRVVDAAIAAAKAGGPARIAVIGNTDLSGTNNYNLVLSRHRADTVRNYMIAHGVDPRDIGVQALGKTDPAVRTADGVREPRNRRVEIVITPMGRPSAPVTSMNAPRPPYDRPVAPVNAPVGDPTKLIYQ
jgi:outer membrane protein OmpA-like peptidoglycan-associated protein